MTDHDGATPSMKPTAHNDRAQQKPASESVFKDAAEAEPQPSPEHDGTHGTDGRENDLDRAEDAGRENGRR